MGHNFRPDYLKLGGCAQPQSWRVLTLTATATPGRRPGYCASFLLTLMPFIHTGFLSSKPYLEVTRCRPTNRLAFWPSVSRSGREAQPYLRNIATDGRNGS